MGCHQKFHQCDYYATRDRCLRAHRTAHIPADNSLLIPGWTALCLYSDVFYSYLAKYNHAQLPSLFVRNTHVPLFRYVLSAVPAARTGTVFCNGSAAAYPCGHHHPFPDLWYSDCLPAVQSRMDRGGDDTFFCAFSEPDEKKTYHLVP